MVKVETSLPSFFKKFIIFSAENSLPIVSIIYCKIKLNNDVSLIFNLSTTSLNMIESKTPYK